MGRPPAASSTETRARIIDGARRCFARYGYDKTTNKDIAAEAGLTTGAIYHYFDSKQELFGAVVEEVNGTVFDAFEAVLEEESTFVGRMRGILEVATDLHGRDRSFALFSATFLVELQRHAELLAAVGLESTLRGREVFIRIAQDAVDAGEVREDVSADALADVITATTLGLAHLGTITDRTQHGAAMDAAARLFAGHLVTPVTEADRTG
jgi:AcrR family transcriptional regulator